MGVGLSFAARREPVRPSSGPSSGPNSGPIFKAHQPNFGVLTDALRTVSDQVRLTPNLPAMDQCHMHMELCDKLDSVLTELGTVRATVSTQANVR